MKKFLITFFILLILAGAAFFAGWVQLTVPPGSYGVIISKTHGVDPKPVKSGEFRWLWQKLIPTNVEITVFRLENERFPINFNSSLPSGESYAAFAGLSSADFSWDLRGEILFSIKPDELVNLATRQYITDQSALENYMQLMAEDIRTVILRTLSSAETDSERLEKIMSGSPDMEMEHEIKTKFPEITGFSFNITSAKFPDFVLYRHARQLYEDFLEKQREFVSSAFSRRAESHIEVQLRIMELELYGELLTKYPVMLEYLTLEKSQQ
jgi:hypothetical protein